MIPSSQAIMMETFPPEEQGLAMSVWGMGLLTSPMLGPTLGGWITYNWSWRWNFYINLPIGIFAAIMVIALRPRSRAYPEIAGARAKDRLSRDHLLWRWAWACCRSSSIAVSAPTGSTRRGSASSRQSQSSRWFCWSIRELHFPEPILDLRIMAIPLFDVSVSLILVMMLVVFGMNLLNPLFFQELLGYSPWKSGIAVLPRGFGTLAGMFFIGQTLAPRVRHALAGRSRLRADGVCACGR